jgi:hypothetical protein
MQKVILCNISSKLNYIFKQPKNEATMRQLFKFPAIHLILQKLKIMWSFRRKEWISAKHECLVNTGHYNAIRSLWSDHVGLTPHPEVIYPARHIVETNISRRAVAGLSIPSTRWTAYTFIYISCYTCCGSLHNLLHLCGQVWLKFFLQRSTVASRFKLSQFPV